VVVMVDFLPDVSIEQEVLKGVAQVVPLNLQKKLPSHDPAHVPPILSTCSGILAWHLLDWDQNLLKCLKNTKILVRVGIGIDNVDLDSARSLGIAVANVPDYGVEEVADSAMNHVLNLMRQTVFASYKQTQGWHTEKAKVATRLRGCTIGLVGLGKIGKATALRAKAFGLHVLFYDPYLEDGIDKSIGISRVDSLEELISKSDILSLHCWLDEKNYNLINERTLSFVKPGGCFLVNTARGGLVDEEALIKAIKEGKVRGAALDVVKEEPYPPTGPLLDPSLPIILTPHIAFLSAESFVEMRRKAAEEVKRVLLGGKPRNWVNQHPKSKL